MEMRVMIAMILSFIKEIFRINTTFIHYGR